MENFKRSTDFINYGTFSKLKGQGVYQIRCEANPNVKRSTLLSACNGNKKSAYGYKWKYVPMDIPTGEYHEID